MDQLELLKQNWKHREQDLPKLTYHQINNMLFKKSTSIVKWIFIISVLELLFWVGITLITPKTSFDLIEKMNLNTTLWIANGVHFMIILFFIYRFYKNYNAIKVTDSTRHLMARILRTRKTVKYFVIYNLLIWMLSIVLINVYFYFNTDLLIQSMNEVYASQKQLQITNKEAFLSKFFIVQLIFVVLLMGVLLVFYRVIYGILLKRLVKNYNELQKIEV